MPTCYWRATSGLESIHLPYFFTHFHVSRLMDEWTPTLYWVCNLGELKLDNWRCYHGAQECEELVEVVIGTVEVKCRGYCHVNYHYYHACTCLSPLLFFNLTCVSPRPRLFKDLILFHPNPHIHTLLPL